MKIYLIKWRYEIRRTINMESMNEIAKFLGEARIEDPCTTIPFIMLSLTITSTITTT